MRTRVERFIVWEVWERTDGENKPTSPPQPVRRPRSKRHVLRLFVLLAALVAFGTGKTLLAPTPMPQIEICSDEIQNLAPCTGR